MLRKNWKTMTLTSLVLLLPMVIGLLLWQQLPDRMPSHWDINGNVDGWSSKPSTVFCFPGLLLAVHWLCLLASQADPKRHNYHRKMFALVLWICPVLSLVLSTLVYAAALGYEIRIEIILPLLMGVMFIIIGNLLPKCPQTYTMGIKLPWTLASEENWNKTHRFGGKVWVIGGILIMATALLGSFWLMMAAVLVMAAAPTLYSYLYYRKHERKGGRNDEA